jgi:hypothetical protein
MRINPKSKKIILFIVSLLAVFSLLAVLPTPAAYATKDGPFTPIPGLGRVPDATLSHMILRLRAWNESQTTIFRDADKLAKDFQSLIDVGKKKKKNVTELETALADFNAEMTVAQGVYKNASKVLVANAGFNSTFNVTDRQAAGQTFLAAREYLRDTHFRLVNAMYNLTKAYKHYRG